MTPHDERALGVEAAGFGAAAGVLLGAWVGSLLPAPHLELACTFLMSGAGALAAAFGAALGARVPTPSRMLAALLPGLLGYLLLTGWGLWVGAGP